MGCAPSTATDQGTAACRTSKKGDEVSDEQQREQARLLEELDRLKPPNSSQGDVCREPIVGRAVIATFLAEGSCNSSFDTFYGQTASRPAPPPDGGLLSDTSRREIQEYLTCLEIPSQQSDPALLEVKCEWENGGSSGDVTSPTHAPARHLSGTLGTDPATNSQVAEIGFFPVTPDCASAEG